MEVHDHARVAAFQRLLVVRLAEDGEHQAVCADGVFHDVRDILFVGDRVEIEHIPARKFLMAGKIVIRAVMNAVEFLPADGEEVLDIARRFRVVR